MIYAKLAHVAALAATLSACSPRADCLPADLSCSPAAAWLYLRQPIAYPRFLYAVANAPGTLLTYAIDRNTGLLSQIASNTLGVAPYDIAANAAGSVLVATDLTANQFHSIRVNVDTGLVHAINSPMLGLASPVGAAINPGGAYAYAVSNSAPNSVHMYAIDSATGSLSSLSPPTINAAATVRLMAFDPLNRFAYVGNQTTPAGVTQFIVNAGTGVLTGNGSVTLPGGFAYGIAVDPAGRFVYVTEFAANDVAVLAINPDGTLAAPAAVFSTAPGTGPADLAIHPGGKFLYVLNQTGPPHYVTQYSINAVSGALTSLGVTPVGSTGVRLRVDPSGRFAYAASISDIRAYAIDPLSGLLTAIGTPTNTGLTLNSIAVVGGISY